MGNYDEKKGDMQMKNKKAIKVLQWAGVLLLAAVVLLGAITAPMAEASKLEASHIKKLNDVIPFPGSTGASLSWHAANVKKAAQIASILLISFIFL